MKNIIKTLIVLYFTVLFSCTNTSVQEKKEDVKQVIVEDTIESKVKSKKDSLPILKEDTIIKVPKVHNDTTPVVGVLTEIEDTDFWGRVTLVLNVNGKYKAFDYWGEPNNQFMGSESFDHVRKLIGKKVSVKFRIEETLEENDLYINNKSIYGKYKLIKTDEQKAHSPNIEGILLVPGKSGDLPSTYQIVDHDGDTTTITAYVYDEHVALNGKKATVYYSHRTKYIVKSVTSFSKEKEVTDTLFLGKWKKEDSSNPIDPTTIEVKNEDGYMIKFSNDDYFVPANDSSAILKGYSNSGNFEIEVISEDPLVISYSDDGRGHFEPVKNERFVKEKK